jgi:hypothetical protein
MVTLSPVGTGSVGERVVVGPGIGGAVAVEVICVDVEAGLQMARGDDQ